MKYHSGILKDKLQNYYILSFVNEKKTKRDEKKLTTHF